ncbi:MAG: hypothetical protein U1E38_01175 [Rhodospirillales bacterium]
MWGTDPGHARRVGAYERALQQRSALLRQDRPDAVWLGALEATMAEHAIAVAAARKQAAAQLSAIADEAQAGMFPGASVAIRGAVEDWLDEVPALAAEDRLRAELEKARAADAAERRRRRRPAPFGPAGPAPRQRPPGRAVLDR